jgi:hypothetical protein
LKEEFPDAFLELFNEPDTAKYTRIRKLNLAEHIIRVEDRRTVKKAFDTRPVRNRKIRRAQTEIGGRWGTRYQGPGSEELEKCDFEERRLPEASEGGQGDIGL